MLSLDVSDSETSEHILVIIMTHYVHQMVELIKTVDRCNSESKQCQWKMLSDRLSDQPSEQVEQKLLERCSLAAHLTEFNF